MEKDKEITYENPKNLVVDKNSRFRADSNSNELMESIKQNGVLEPILVRKEDRVVICGNRRLSASMKLQLKEIPVIFVSGVSDKELLIMNLTENLQRKDISSIEVGRTCENMLKNSEFKTSIPELATLLGMKSSRLKVCLEAFRSLPAEFRDKVVHLNHSRERKFGDLPENVVSAILNFSRYYKKIDNNELKHLLRKAGEEMWGISKIALIGQLYTQGIPLKKAISLSRDYRQGRINLLFLKTELATILKKEGIRGANELIIKLIKEKYPNLLY